MADRVCLNTGCDAERQAGCSYCDQCNYQAVMKAIDAGATFGPIVTTAEAEGRVEAHQINAKLLAGCVDGPCRIEGGKQVTCMAHCPDVPDFRPIAKWRGEWMCATEAQRLREEYLVRVVHSLAFASTVSLVCLGYLLVLVIRNG